MENWKDIPELKGKYQCSDIGNIRRINKDYRCEKYKVLKKQINKDGYVYVHCTLTYRKLVHRIVAELFIPNPNEYSIINHKDLDKTNNSITNLEWCTHSQNSIHANANGKLGRMHRNVENINTGEKFNSVKIVAELLDMDYKQFHAKIYKLKEYKGYKLNEKTYRTIS